jgi:hypothetical protein
LKGEVALSLQVISPPSEMKSYKTGKQIQVL